MNKIVLIFDDNSAETCAYLIEHQSDFLCLPYEDSKSCLSDLEAGLKFDLFLVDRSLDITSSRNAILAGGFNPVTGDDLGKKVRQLYPQLPIIRLSAYDDKPIYSNRHLVKPVGSKDIIEAIQTFL